MKKLLFLCFITGFVAAKAQNIVLAEWFEKLEPKQFYFVGQGHNNEANGIIEKEFLFALNKKYNVRYHILEYNHSVAFLLNQYLQNGEDALLTFIHPEAGFSFIRAVKAYNDLLPVDRKICFYGLDFENRQDGRYTRKAITLIQQQLNLLSTATLWRLLQDIIDSSPSGMQKALGELKVWLNKNESTARNLLKEYYTDLLLITHAQYHFSPRRDEAMFDNFHRLYQELVKTEALPSFFGSFGIGHVNPKNSKSIAMRLMNNESSVIRNKVSITGMHYFNCAFGKNTPVKPTYGNLDFLCNKTTLEHLAAGEKLIGWLSVDQLLKLNCSKAIKGLDGVIIVRNFNSSEFW